MKPPMQAQASRKSNGGGEPHASAGRYVLNLALVESGHR